MEKFLNYLSAVRGLSENTVIGYKNDLTLLQGFLSPEIEVSSVTKENLLLCIGQLSKQKKAAASINRFISAVRTLFSFGLRYQYIEKNPDSGDAPQKWIIKRRLEAAHDLIKSGKKVTEACFDVGFINLSHFSKIYKDAYGVAPSMQH